MRLFALLITVCLTGAAHGERFFGDFDVVGEPVAGGNPGVVEELNRDRLSVNADAGTEFELPVRYFSPRLMARSQTRLSALFPADTSPRRDPMTRGQGSSLTEAGVTLDRLFGPGQDYRFDAVFKARREMLYSYTRPTEAAFNPTFQAPGTLTASEGFNINAGLKKTFGDLDMALRVERLFPHRDDGRLVSSPYRTSALASLATYLDPAWWWPGARLNINIDARDAFEQDDDARFAGANLSFDGFGPASLRLGYRHDLIDHLDTSATVGLGFSLFERFNFDISGIRNPDDSYGVLARLLVTQL
ncbi:hypothetical protein [Alloalcanivorax gelatiniphagus]|uniref:Uncharacterized protein n=1 Tax=Alloalcanivorax gelatiniphagus TaxID=1194167 RepID=A0ABY2XNI2_9GAMM|nr:hypothetical protein [Alloalcanivorax gelatiniphagus]TMW13482.1 hypothetical protein FGS76_06680 [Alloalcanivorax gelatiniphagus]|tara:strand:+ start:2302 stop:3210 length:909 start_codon:yes stop_codon:yes gene_type:complete